MPKPSLGLLRQILDKPITKRRSTAKKAGRTPRKLTQRRMGCIKEFLKTVHRQPEEYGEVGSEGWIQGLIVSLKERQKSAIIPSDVVLWLKTYPEFFRDTIRTIRKSAKVNGGDGSSPSSSSASSTPKRVSPSSSGDSGALPIVISDDDSDDDLAGECCQLVIKSVRTATVEDLTPTGCGSSQPQPPPPPPPANQSEVEPSLPIPIENIKQEIPEGGESEPSIPIPILKIKQETPEGEEPEPSIPIPVVEPSNQIQILNIKQEIPDGEDEGAGAGTSQALVPYNLLSAEPLSIALQFQSQGLGLDGEPLSSGDATTQTDATTIYQVEPPYVSILDGYVCISGSYSPDLFHAVVMYLQNHKVLPSLIKASAISCTPRDGHVECELLHTPTTLVEDDGTTKSLLQGARTMMRSVERRMEEGTENSQVNWPICVHALKTLEICLNEEGAAGHVE